MRKFETGATRDDDDNKPDYEGFLSPLVLEAYGRYMNKNRVQADGGLRDSDNWQKGIPLSAYMKSGWRHFVEWWRLHRKATDGAAALDETRAALCALLFNVMGYLHELERGRLKPGEWVQVEDVALDPSSIERIRARLEESVGKRKDKD